MMRLMKIVHRGALIAGGIAGAALGVYRAAKALRTQHKKRPPTPKTEQEPDA